MLQEKKSPLTTNRASDSFRDCIQGVCDERYREVNEKVGDQHHKEVGIMQRHQNSGNARKKREQNTTKA